MAFKIKTSKKTEEIFSRLELSHNLPCYTLVKLAMALSLRDENPLTDADFRTNTLGRELNRQTITGDAGLPLDQEGDSHKWGVAGIVDLMDRTKVRRQ